MTKDTRTALLDAAETAARSLGFDGFSYADLAEGVGIRKASIHYHFPSKADLAVALVRRYSETMQVSLERIDAATDTGADRLRRLCAHYRSALDGGRSVCLCVSFSASRDSLTDEVIAGIKTFRRMMAAWLIEVFALGQRDGTIAHVGLLNEEASATLALLEGAHLIARAEKDPLSFDAAVAGLLGRLT